MDFLKSLGETVNDAVDFIVEKNRKFTKITKIKRLIKKETDSIIRSYINLGKYYYSELRDVPNKDMQGLCESIDVSKNEIKKLKEKLSEVNSEENCSNFRDLLDNEEPMASETSASSDVCNCVDNIDSDDKTCHCPENIDLGDGKCHCNDENVVITKTSRKINKK
ncbi:MAG: hypothetical protein RUMPE_00820 [Eubacteriales bacterium SKADARSKE-1]|nr:hypothetical protein [Eubacteriales bacterium SKADARSKE-1]